MAGRVIDVTMQLIDKVTAPLSGITGALADSGKNISRAGKEITNTGKSLARTGQALTSAVTMPIIAAGTGAVMTAANFEAGMSKVHAISGEVAEKDLKGIMNQAEAMGLTFEKGSNATETAMNILSAKAQEMGKKTKFSATEAADAFSYMAMAGWKTEQMMAGIDGVMYLAGATGTDLAQTSDIVTDAMTAFGMAADGTSTVLKDGMEVEVDNVTRFVDTLAATANNANTNVEMLGESFKYVAPMAGSLGYGVEDVSIGLGLMANSGIKASQAGTSLRGLLSNMAKRPKEAAIAMDTLGVSLSDGQGNMKSFMDIMVDLREAFPALKMNSEEFFESMTNLDAEFEAGNLTEKQYEKAQESLINLAYGAEGALKAQYASMLAGKTGLSGLLAIVNASDADFENLTNAVYNSGGACEDMYNVMNDNLMGQLTILKSSVEALAISFGNTLMPYIKKGAEFIQGLVDKFNALDETQRLNIVKIAGMAAAIGPVLLVIGKVTIGVGNFVTAVGNIGKALKAAGSLGALLTGPGAIVVGIIAAIGVALALVVTHWDECKAAAKAFWDSIQPIVQHLQQKWEELGNKFNEVWTSKIQPAWQKFSDKASALWTRLQPIFQKIGALVKEVFEIKFKLAIDIGCKVLEFLFDTVGVVVEGILTAFGALADFTSGFMDAWSTVWNSVKEVFSSVWEGIQADMEVIAPKVDTLKQKWDELGQLFTDIWTNHIQPTWDNFSQKASEVWTFLQPIFEKIGNVMKDIFEIKFKLAIDIACATFQFFSDAIGTIIEYLVDTFNGVIDFITGVFTGDWSRAWEGVKEIFDAKINLIRGIAQDAVDFISGIFKGIAETISGLFDKIDKLKEKAKGIANLGKSSDEEGNAVGTSYWRGGTTMVHERGAEIIDLPKGTRIWPHSESLKMAYQQGQTDGGGGKGNINITVAKLAESIQVRSDADIEAIAAALANKLEQTAQNIGGGELGYVY